MYCLLVTPPARWWRPRIAQLGACDGSYMPSYTGRNKGNEKRSSMSAEEQIRNLMGRYIQAHDTHDVETIVNLFTEDGLFANPNGEFRGHARIREFFEGSRSRATPDRKGKLMCANSIITVDGETASALTDVVGLQRTATRRGLSDWSPSTTIDSFIATANGGTRRSTFWAEHARVLHVRIWSWRRDQAHLGREPASDKSFTRRVPAILGRAARPVLFAHAKRASVRATRHADRGVRWNPAPTHDGVSMFWYDDLQALVSPPPSPTLVESIPESHRAVYDWYVRSSRYGPPDRLTLAEAVSLDDRQLVRPLNWVANRASPNQRRRHRARRR